MSNIQNRPPLLQLPPQPPDIFFSFLALSRQLAVRLSELPLLPRPSK